MTPKDKTFWIPDKIQALDVFMCEGRLISDIFAHIINILGAPASISLAYKKTINQSKTINDSIG
jgi:hypothetical protein